MSRAQLTSTVEQSSGGAVAPFLAGKNKIINGDFAIAQRGQTFSNPSDLTYIVDRFLTNHNGTGVTRTISQQAFDFSASPAADKLPITGYPSDYFLRYAISAAGTGNTYNFIVQRIEDVRAFAGQTVTISYWAKADTSRSITGPTWRQSFGSGGSADIDTASGATFNLTTSWQRFTATFAIPSVSGKTIGVGSYVNLFIASLPTNTTFTIDIWGVQVEAGSVATPFTTATGTLQGELAACQRYYFRNTTDSTGNYLALGFTATTTTGQFMYPFPVTMRVAPSALEYANCAIIDGVTQSSITGLVVNWSSKNYINIYTTGSTGLTAFRPSLICANGSVAYIGFSAEL
jgi:hypothetical protein